MPDDPPNCRVYLAGPDVFLPDPDARGARLKEVCARHGLHGRLSRSIRCPAEPDSWSSLLEWERIALRNEAHIRSCDALIANLTPFRGASADVGTVFELGFMRALGRPVFGWTNTTASFLERTRAAVSRADDRDMEGLAIEAFGCVDNLMIDGAVRASGGAILLSDVAGSERWRDIASFERCVAACAAALVP